MAVQPCDNGVQLHFLDKNGIRHTRAQVFGKYARFYSKPRPEAPGDTNPIHGSQDWLTDIIVVDDLQKLEYLKPTQIGAQDTSCCSKGVLVQWWVGEDKSHQNHALSLGYGHFDGKYYRVHSLDIMPADTEMNPQHNLWKMWQGSTDKLQILKAEGVL